MFNMYGWVRGWSLPLTHFFVFLYVEPLVSLRDKGGYARLRRAMERGRSKGGRARGWHETTSMVRKHSFDDAALLNK